MAKWDSAPVAAVKVMINTLVPTAVFSSYPRTPVRIKSIIIPPPAPIKPQIKPIIAPPSSDWTSRFLGSTAAMLSLVVITGLTRNLIPSSRSIQVEKPPMVRLGTRLDTQLPTRVRTSTDPIITRPFLMSRFLFLW